LDINFIPLIDKDSELIRRFKRTTVSLHDSYVNLPEKWFVYRDRGFFGLKLNVHYSAMKWAIKGHYMEIGGIIRNKISSQKKLKGNSLCSN